MQFSLMLLLIVLQPVLLCPYRPAWGQIHGSATCATAQGQHSEGPDLVECHLEILNNLGDLHLWMGEEGNETGQRDKLSYSAVFKPTDSSGAENNLL